MAKWTLFPPKPRSKGRFGNHSDDKYSSKNCKNIRLSISSISHEGFLASKGKEAPEVLKLMNQNVSSDTDADVPDVYDATPHLLFNPSSLASEKAELEKHRRSQNSELARSMAPSSASGSMDVGLPSISNTQNEKKEVAVMEAELKASLKSHMIEGSKLTYQVKERESRLQELNSRLQEFTALSATLPECENAKASSKKSLVGVSRSKRLRRAQLLIDIAETRELGSRCFMYSKVLRHMLRRDEESNIERQRAIAEKEEQIRGVKRQRNKLRLLLRDLEDMKKATLGNIASAERNSEMKRSNWQSQVHALKVKRELEHERTKFRKKIAMDHKLRLLAMRGDLDENAENELKKNKRQMFARQLSVMFARSVSVSNLHPTAKGTEDNSVVSNTRSTETPSMASERNLMRPGSTRKTKLQAFSDAYKRLYERVGHFDPDDFVNRFSQQLTERRVLAKQIDAIESTLESRKLERVRIREELQMLRFGDSRNAVEKEAISKVKFVESKLTDASNRSIRAKKQYEIGKTLIYKIREALFLLNKKVHKIRVPDRYKVNSRVSMVHDVSLLAPLEAQLVGMLRAMAIKDDGIVESKQIVDQSHSMSHTQSTQIISHIPVINRDQLNEVEEQVIRIINSPAGNNIRINRAAIQERLAHGNSDGNTAPTATERNKHRAHTPPLNKNVANVPDEEDDEDEDSDEELTCERAEQAFMRYDRANRHVIKVHYLSLLLKDLGLYVGEASTKSLIPKLVNIKQEVALHSFLRWINTVVTANSIPTRSDMKAKGTANQTQKNNRSPTSNRNGVKTETVKVDSPSKNAGNHTKKTENNGGDGTKAPTKPSSASEKPHPNDSAKGQKSNKPTTGNSTASTKGRRKPRVKQPSISRKKSKLNTSNKGKLEMNVRPASAGETEPSVRKGSRRSRTQREVGVPNQSRSILSRTGQRPSSSDATTTR